MFCKKEAKGECIDSCGAHIFVAGEEGVEARAQFLLVEVRKFVLSGANQNYFDVLCLGIAGWTPGGFLRVWECKHGCASSVFSVFLFPTLSFFRGYE